jgi:hypothetical protein
MAKDNEDILLDSDGDEKVDNGDFAIGDGSLEDCECILNSNTGTVKSDPLIGANLFLLMNGQVTKTEIRQRVQLNLARDNKFPQRINVVDGNIGIEL